MEKCEGVLGAWCEAGGKLKSGKVERWKGAGFVERWKSAMEWCGVI